MQVYNAMVCSTYHMLLSIPPENIFMLSSFKRMYPHTFAPMEMYVWQAIVIPHKKELFRPATMATGFISVIGKKQKQVSSASS